MGQTFEEIQKVVNEGYKPHLLKPEPKSIVQARETCYRLKITAEEVKRILSKPEPELTPDDLLPSNSPPIHYGRYRIDAYHDKYSDTVRYAVSVDIYGTRYIWERLQTFDTFKEAKKLVDELRS